MEVEFMSRKGENIYKRKDGRWEGRYIKYHDYSGKPYYGYLYARSYSEIKEKLTSAKAKSEDTAPNLKNNKSIKDICTLWLSDVKIQSKLSTYVKYYNIVNMHILPYFGNLRLHMITAHDLKEFVNYMLTEGRLDGKGGLSAKTVRDYISVFRLIIKYADGIGIYCSINTDDIKIKTILPNINTLSSSDQKRLSSYLINNIDNINLGILICLYTGIRLGEMCALKFNDISLSENVIHVNKTMQRIQNPENDGYRKTKIIITPPKSAKSERDIPIPRFIAGIIQKYYKSDAYVLTGTEQYVEPRALEYKFKKILQRCGLEKINFHALRHTFATYSIEHGFEVKSLSEILGHSSVNITLNRYVHSSMKQKQLNMSKITSNLFYLQSVL